VKLQTCVEVYIRNRENAGYGFTRGAQILRQFVRWAGNISIRQITADCVGRFLDGSQSTNAWRARHGILRNCFEYWYSRGQIAMLHLPPLRPEKATKFYPYIYSRAEIRALLNSVVESQRFRRSTVDPETLRVMLLFLYGTGLRVGEALSLRRADVDLTQGILELRRTESAKRRLPTGPDIRSLLDQYMHRGPSRHLGSERTLFAGETGEPIPYSTLCSTFQRLRRVAQVTRGGDAGCEPRLDDLRHTFAVHSIASWRTRGLETERMLPLLAAYMGNVRLDRANRYLKLTPAGFQRTLNKISTSMKRAT
jgi:integrase/recombinase XerD